LVKKEDSELVEKSTFGLEDSKLIEKGLLGSVVGDFIKEGVLVEEDLPKSLHHHCRYHQLYH